MAKPGHLSFRRILLSYILLLSVPVLLVGEVFTYKKVRSSLEETVRQNLTESAIRKGQHLQESIKALQATLLIASELPPLQSGTALALEEYLEQLQARLPVQIQCAQLTDLRVGQVTASTCRDQLQMTLYSLTDYYLSSANKKLVSGALSPSVDLWPQQQYQIVPNRSIVHITPAVPVTHLSLTQKSIQTSVLGQLHLVLSVPVYNRLGQLQYALSVQAAFRQWERDSPRSLLGYTVVIDEDGTILAHPVLERVGRLIQQDPDANTLEDIRRNAISAGDSNVRYLFGLGKQGAEWLAGYSPVTIPMAVDQKRTWVILAVTRLDNALYGLEGLKQILVVLTLGLLVAMFLATLYMSRDLSLPLEQLGNYALYIQHRHTARKNQALQDLHEFLPPTVWSSEAMVFNQVPQNFKIQEMNQLAEVLHSMVNRLEERAEELEAAWREAETANQLKSEFLANTSHELRTPLNAIIGCLRLVRDGCCDNREEELEFLKRADDAAVHLLKIINDLLDLAKIEAGGVPVMAESVDLQQALQEVVDLQAVQIQQKGLWIVLPDFSQPIQVQSDPAKLRQVLINVISNAVKFTEQGGIAIAARIESPETSLQKGDRPDVVILVKDTGIGIDPANQPKLFRPFVMVDGSTTRKFEGTGLGLAISRNLMELMGGSVTLYSAGLGEGTTVEIRLPLSSCLPRSVVGSA
ncbi:MAG: ATP-binding protein [Leptolyngbyaceae bacterium]|nr:ATP-binding protein [Leptolyngbyaceae bacterium]